MADIRIRTVTFYKKQNNGVKIMKNEYTAVVKQEDDWWIGWIAEIPGVNCHEKTLRN
jgi:hypothetical protein